MWTTNLQTWLDRHPALEVMMLPLLCDLAHEAVVVAFPFEAKNVLVNFNRDKRLQGLYEHDPPAAAYAAFLRKALQPLQTPVCSCLRFCLR